LGGQRNASYLRQPELAVEACNREVIAASKRQGLKAGLE